MALAPAVTLASESLRSSTVTWFCSRRRRGAPGKPAGGESLGNWTASIRVRTVTPAAAEARVVDREVIRVLRAGREIGRLLAQLGDVGLEVGQPPGDGDAEARRGGRVVLLVKLAEGALQEVLGGRERGPVVLHVQRGRDHLEMQWWHHHVHRFPPLSWLQTRSCGQLGTVTAS